jgi:hypothetical protein
MGLDEHRKKFIALAQRYNEVHLLLPWSGGRDFNVWEFDLESRQRWTRSPFWTKR